MQQYVNNQYLNLNIISNLIIIINQKIELFYLNKALN